VNNIDEDDILAKLYAISEDFLQVELTIINETPYSRMGIQVIL
jgi:hypothetical protein